MLNKNTKRFLLAGLIVILLSQVMSPLFVSAQPGGTPPGGNIDARFNTVSAVNSGGITLGEDLGTNVAGFIKLFSAGANAFYTTFTAGTQTENATYTLPTAMPSGGDKFLKATTAGVMSWADAATSESDPLAVLKATFTTVGDILVGSGAGTYARLGVGTNDQVLKSNGTTAGWAADSTGTDTLDDLSDNSISDLSDVGAMTEAAYDLLYFNTDWTRLAKGTANQVLKMDGTGTGFAWAADATGAGGYATVQEEGTGLTQRTTLNFIGSSVTAADDSGNARTNVTITETDPNNRWTLNGSDIYSNNTGEVGIGVTAPTRKLEVDSASGSTAIYGQYSANILGYLGGASYGAFGQSTATRFGYLGGASYGAYGQYSATQLGILGLSTAGAYGQYDANNYAYLGTNGYGVQGVGGTYGVAGQASGSTGTGVYGNATSATGASYGLRGVSASSTGFGGHFTNSSSGTGLYATSTSGLAAHIAGNARLTGTLADVNNEVGTSGQVLSTTGTGVDWVAAGVGTITGVTAGDGLSGGGTSGAVTLDVAAGTGISVAGDTVSATLGTAIDGTEITDGVIEEADLEATNAATDNYVLSYDLASLGFTWVVDATGLTSEADTLATVTGRGATTSTDVTMANVAPVTDNTYDLGSTTNRWQDLHLGPASLNVYSTTGTSGAGSDYVRGNLNFTGTTGAGAMNLVTSNVGTATGGQINLSSALPAGGTTNSALNLTASTNLGASDELLNVGDSGGNFLTTYGNGTTNISAENATALIANSGTSASAFRVSNSSGSFSFGVDANGGYAQPLTVDKGMWFYDYSGTGYMGINGSTHNVGIGTTSPSQSLDVNGGTRLRGALYDINNSVGTSGQVLSTTTTGVDWVAAGVGTITGVTAGNGLTGGGTSGAVTLDAGAGTGISVAADAVALDYTATLAGNPALSAGQAVFDGADSGGGLLFEGAADTFEGLLTLAGLGADRTWTLPNETGTICTTGSVCSGYQPSGSYLTSESDPLAVLKATFTTAGDLLLGSGAGTYARLGIGGNGTVLKSNGTTATWGTDSTGTDTLDDLSDNSISDLSDVGAMTEVAYDLLYFNTDWTRLAKGTANQVLKMDGTGTGFAWAADAGITAETGDIEGVTAGAGLTGGGTSGTVTVDVAAGTGISVAGDTVSATLGTAIDGTEITDGVIEEADLEATNAATDNYVLSYDLASLGFTWVADATGISSESDPLAVLKATFTTAGDLLLGSGAGTYARLGIGGNGTVLKSNGTTATWGTDSTGTDTLDDLSDNSISDLSDVGAMTEAAYDLLYYNTDWTRLAKGAANQVLKMDGTGTGFAWAADAGITAETGDIEGVTAGAGLTGGGTSGTVTVDVAAGTGISVAGDVVSATLGTAIDGTEITDGVIEEADLEATNAATDNYILSYDLASLGFTWVQDAYNSAFDTEAEVDAAVANNGYLTSFSEADPTLTNDGAVTIGAGSGAVTLTIDADAGTDATMTWNGATDYMTINAGNKGTMFHNYGSSNLFFGANSGNTSLTSLENIGIGPYSLYGLTGGYENVGIGVQSLYSVTTGHYNTAIGTYTMDGLQGGNENIAIGTQSSRGLVSGSYNTAVGNGSMMDNSSGTYNVAIGNAAGFHIAGSQNTMLGARTGGNTLATGSGNVYIGYQAGWDATGDNKLYLDNSSTATPLIYGDFSTDALTFNGSATATQTMYQKRGTGSTYTVCDSGNNCGFLTGETGDISAVYAGTGLVGGSTSGDATLGITTATDDDLSDRAPYTAGAGIGSGFYQTSSATTTENWPVDGSWYHLINSQYNDTSSNYAMQFAGDFFNNTELYYRSTAGSGSTAWTKIWNAANDGSGSGLDADTLDGVSSGSFLTSVPTLDAVLASGNSSSRSIILTATSASGLSVSSTSSTAAAVYGTATNTTNSNYGVRGNSASSSGYGGYFTNSSSGVGAYVESTTGNGIQGVAQGTGANSSIGVYGLSQGDSGTGVSGVVNAASGLNYGVRGQSASGSGYGVYGSNSVNGAYGYFGSRFYGAYGQFDASNYAYLGVSSGYGVEAVGGTYGVYGRTSSTTGMGVNGEASATTGTAIGVKGYSAAASGYGVDGSAEHATGSTFGVQGSASSTAGTGVSGFASAATGTTYGVQGTSQSTSGYGGFFQNTAASGTTYGIRAQATSASGYAVFGSNSNLRQGHLGGLSYGAYGQDATSTRYGYLGSASYGAYGQYDSNNYGYIGANGVGVAGVNLGTGDGGWFQNTSTGNALHAYQGGTGAVFRADDVVSDTTPFLIDSSGYVGVGTTTPAGVLNLASTDATNMFVVEDAGDGDASTFVIDSTGQVGIGAAPSYKLHVYTTGMSVNSYFHSDGGGATNLGLRLATGTDGASSTTNRLIAFYDGLNTTEQGYLSNSAGSVTLTAFTGSHLVKLPERDNVKGYEYGSIVSVREVTTEKDSKQPKYLVETSQNAYDSNIFGVYSNIDTEYENQHVIYAVGDGHVLVTSENGEIKAGDPITSSSYPGLGMKATEAGTILGIATQDWDPATATETVTLPDGRVVKKALVAVFYYPGFPYAGDTKALKSMVEEQQMKLVDQQKKLDDLQSQMDELKTLVQASADKKVSSKVDAEVASEESSGSNLLTYLTSVVGAKR